VGIAILKRMGEGLEILEDDRGGKRREVEGRIGGRGTGVGRR
jgi:hypothetical protein